MESSLLDEMEAALSRTAVLQEKLREAIQRVAVAPKLPGQTRQDVDNEQECLLSVRCVCFPGSHCVVEGSSDSDPSTPFRPGLRHSGLLLTTSRTRFAS